MSSAAIQYVSPLGQIIKDQALNQLATGDMSAVTQTPAVDSGASTPAAPTGITVNTRRGIITMYTSAIGANSSTSFTLTNRHIKETSIVLIGVAQHDAYAVGTAWATAQVNRARNGSADVVLANGGSTALTSTQIKLWFIVLDL